jgi:type IV pilus assembly protein PilB
MTETHRFADEWILRAIQNVPGVGPDVILTLREKKVRGVADALIDGGIATRSTINDAVKSFHKINPVELGDVVVDRLAVALFTESVCLRLRVFPIRARETVIEVAMTNPLDLEAQADLAALSGREVIPLYSTPKQVDSLITEHYKADLMVSGLVERLGVDENCEFVGPETEEQPIQGEPSVRAPVIKLVNSLLTKAILSRASDVHIEQSERGTEIRFRIDGTLRNVMTLPRNIGAGPLVSRIKVMGNLDVADRLKPQDGRARIRVSNNDIGLRISTLPTQFGEKVVIRLLDPRAAQKTLIDMGFGSANVARLETLLNVSQGVIVVTGPTGSGKTTTLYSLLNKLKSPDINIMTVEDPIEYRLEGINQVQVNDRQGMSFATVLRSVLRQDPDAILVGEMRDAETASIAFQAALTGHLVLTTLHTNDALSAVSRLADMGVERFKIAPALLAITAQRLVRRLCSACRIPVPANEIPPPVIHRMRRYGLEPTLFRAGGCPLCGFSGYVGRLALMEFLNVGRDLREKIGAGADAGSLRMAAELKGDLKTILEDGLWHLSRGDTSLEEIAPHVTLNDGDTAVEPEKRPPIVSPTHRRILVADDDPVIRTILRTILSTAGFEVVEAADGRDALLQAGQHPPDLLICDLHMPHEDGYEVIKGIRGVVGLSGLPIIILTNDTEDASQFQAMELGADDYLAKPIKPALVLARIHAVLRRAGRAEPTASSTA